ncbi:MAG: ParA family protein [Bacilli bacterium]
MLLLLEFDRGKQADAISAAERAGLTLKAVDHEDQLSQVDLTAVELLLVGKDWPPEMVQRLRNAGLASPAITVASTADDGVYEMAKDLGCVDVVTYPLPMDYLRRWLPVEEAKEPPVGPTTALTPMEAILKRRSSPVSTGVVTYAKPPLRPNDPDPLLRGRVIVIHSARGGVGKSTLTALLARALAKQGVAVGVIDLDPKGNLQAIHHRPAALTTDDFTRLPTQMDEATLRESLVRVEDWYLLPSGQLRDGLDHTTLRRLIHQFATSFDIVLIDTSPSSPATYAALERADRVVFAMTPEWMAFKRFLEEYELVRHLKTPARVVVAVNRIRAGVAEHRRALRLLEEASIPSDVVHIPEDRRLYRDLMTAGPLAGSRQVQEAVAQVLNALRVVPERENVRRTRRLRRMREVGSR